MSKIDLTGKSAVAIVLIAVFFILAMVALPVVVLGLLVSVLFHIGFWLAALYVFAGRIALGILLGR